MASLRSSLASQRREIVGVGVHVIAIPGLAGAAVAAAVMSDAAISAAGQKKHLIFEGVRVERPAMAEYNGLSRAPVFVIDLGAIFGGDCAHKIFSLSCFG